MNIRKITAVIMAALIIASFSACGSDKTSNNSTSEPVKLLDTAEMFSSKDIETGYDESECTVITLTGNSASIKGKGASVKGSVITISSEGDYIISGKLDSGCITIDADKSDKIRLILRGVNITSSTCAAINVIQADKVFITLDKGSENTISNVSGANAEDDADAAIFSKDDLTINGQGKLTVTANTGHGIVSKDDLVITGGSYSITSEKKALDANDSLRIAGGSFTIDSGTDALHAESDDASKGFIYIAIHDVCNCSKISSTKRVERFFIMFAKNYLLHNTISLSAVLIQQSKADTAVNLQKRDTKAFDRSYIIAR